MRATLSQYRHTPRKTRLVTNLLKGKSALEALTTLTFLDKRAAPAIAKLIRSAVANAEKQGEDPKQLYIADIVVDKGIVITRAAPRAFGRSAPIRRRLSHVTITLAKRGAQNAQRRKRKSVAPRSTLRAAHHHD